MKNNNERVFCETLDSGIRVVGEQMPSFRSVALGVWVGAGSVYENSDEGGISHFIEHMLFKGTKNRSAAQIADEIDSIGGNINAFTSKECTCFYTNVLDEDISLAADVLGDMVNNPLLDAGDIKREQGVVCEEISMTEDSPEDVAHETLCQTYYDGNPLSRPILGTKSSVESFSADDINRYMDRLYVPKNIVISCAGNFDKDSLLNLVNEKINKKSNSLEVAKADCGKHIDECRFVAVNKNIEQAHIAMAFPGCAMNDRLQYAMILVSNVFGGAMSSRLFQKIREQSGLAYSVYSATMSYRTTGYFSLYAGTSAKEACNVSEMMLNELDEIKRNGISVSEFERSKNQLRGSFVIAQESTQSHSSSLGKALLLKDEVYSPMNVLDRLKKVTMDDCIEAIAYFADFSRMACVLTADTNKVDADKLSKLVADRK